MFFTSHSFFKGGRRRYRSIGGGGGSRRSESCEWLVVGVVDWIVVVMVVIQ